MTNEQKELEREFELAICQLNMLIEFEKQHVPHDLDTPSIPQMLESARDTFMKLHVDWRAHLGDPILDKHEVIARTLIKLATNIAEKKVEV